MVFYIASHLSPRHLYTVSEPDGHGILTVDPTLDGEFSEDKLPLLSIESWTYYEEGHNEISLPTTI